MAQAAAEVTGFTTRAQAIFPPGSQPPFILRFDASTLPVGQLVLSSTIRTNNELMDLANVYVRASFTQPGIERKESIDVSEKQTMMMLAPR